MGFTREKFDHDLLSGEAFEALIKGLVDRLEPSCWYLKAEGNHPAFDFSCTHCGSTIECKSDYQATSTGNFCLELKLLQHSTARWLVYGMRVGDDKWNDFIFIFDLPAMRDWIKEQLMRRSGAVRAVQGGDQNHWLYLVKRSFVQQMPVVCINMASRQRPLGLDDPRMIQLQKEIAAKGKHPGSY